ncbi:MAG: hypothetical protein ACXIUQ_19410 [Cecembia sp.]
MKKRYLILIMILLVVCLGYLVTIYDFAGKVRNETKSNILSHKNFIKSVSFKGIIVDKKMCFECEQNKYQLTVELDDFDINNIEFSFRAYPPYYSMTSNKLILSVNNVIFDYVQMGDNFLKRNNSDELEVGGRNFLYLNKSKYQWLSLGE